MNDKKHIDRLFQERFKDFEATPSDAVWEHIEAQLNKDKKKRRVIPIWWRYAGAAALLLLLLTVGGIYFNAPEETHPNQVVETEDATLPKQKSEKSGKIINSNETEIAVEQHPSEKNKVEAINGSTGNEHSAHASNPSSNVSNPSKEPSVAETISVKNENESKLNTASYKKSNATNSLLSTKNNHAVASHSEEKNNAVNNTGVLNNSENKEETIQDKQVLIATDKAKESIANASKENTPIAEVKDEKTNKNALTIEEALDETKDKIEKEKNLNRWSIAPNAAPVYFNTLGEGSSIDPQFNSNSKTGELNMSYGINASYAINDKLKVRSGINRVNLGYNTNNVVVFQSVGISSTKRALKNLDASPRSTTSDNISIISGQNLNAKPESFGTTNTSINQDLGYIEVPLEIQYALSNKKLSVNVIGGFSSFFLSDNKIYSEAQGGSKLYLGEANNINKVSYSANVGLGFNYKASKKIDLNIEPMFKYQINTFNNTSGDFTPYFIGVYTGFAIKF
ncbi:hypothetical protein [Mariniflexile sp.]|uniref:hypothetical protein n=1 Tax=Mariniflexile sp. TaxID=1979402 RepID=UPI004048B239